MQTNAIKLGLPFVSFLVFAPPGTVSSLLLLSPNAMIGVLALDGARQARPQDEQGTISPHRLQIFPFLSFVLNVFVPCLCPSLPAQSKGNVVDPLDVIDGISLEAMLKQ
jgi:hypothetical protein